MGREPIGSNATRRVERFSKNNLLGSPPKLRKFWRILLRANRALQESRCQMDAVSGVLVPGALALRPWLNKLFGDYTILALSFGLAPSGGLDMQFERGKPPESSIAPYRAARVQDER
jgi:hypothetical protein